MSSTFNELNDCIEVGAESLNDKSYEVNAKKEKWIVRGRCSNCMFGGYAFDKDEFGLFD